MAATAVRRPGLAALAIAVYGVVVCVYLLLPWPLDASTADVAFRVAAPLGALAACLGALLALPPSAVGPWSMLCAGAFAAACSGVLLTDPLTPSVTGVERWGMLLGSASTLLFAGGTAWLIHQRERARAGEIALDAALLIAGAAVLLDRYAPGVRTAFEGGGDPLQAFHAVAQPLGALCGVVFAGALLASRREAGTGDFAALLAGAAALLAIAAVPAALDLDIPTRNAFSASAVAAWGCLAFAALRVARGGGQLFLGIGAGAGSSLLRQAAAPIVALILAVTVTDAALRPPMQQSTGYFLAILGLLLAVRLNALLKATRARSTERRQLAQSRALVEVSHALAGATDLDTTLHRVSHWACQLVNAEASVLELLTESGDAMDVHAAVGFTSSMIGMRFPVEGTFTGWAVRHGEARVTLDPRFETDIAPEARALLGKRPTAVAPLRYHGRSLGALTCIGPQPFDAADIELLGALADQAAIAIENARLFEEVNRLSMTDPLTGLANRRRLEQDLAREFEAARRGRGLVAVMFDLNEFKEYNDRYGHLAGDDALRVFGDVLAQETRAMNSAARFGGDEFLALLSDIDAAGARIFIERVRHRYHAASARAGRSALTFSAGFATYTSDMLEPADLLARADEALYRSKAERTRVG
jgi:diguanylate cyclase (GGDEF)-like protein